jgi:hypothetical protein
MSLQLNSQQWNLAGSDGMKLFLPRQHRDRSVYFQTDWSFVPSGAAVAPMLVEAPKLRLRLIGCVPGLRDWRDLENLFLGYHEPVDGKEPEDDVRGPDIWIWLPGETMPLRFGHWETDLKFSERRGCEFEFSMEAIILSERASKFRLDCGLKEFFQQPVPPDWEQPEWANEVDDQLSFAGRIELREILCSVPINCAQPLDWARQSARRELAVEEFGTCTVHDQDCPGKFKLRDVTSTGRVVVLPLPAID